MWSVVLVFVCEYRDLFNCCMCGVALRNISECCKKLHKSFAFYIEGIGNISQVGTVIVIHI